MTSTTRTRNTVKKPAAKKPAPAKKAATKKPAPAKPAAPKRRVGSADAPGTDVGYRGVGWVVYWPTVGNIGGMHLADALGVEVTWVDNVALGLRINGPEVAVKKAEGALLGMWAAARPAVKAWVGGGGATAYAEAADNRARFRLDKEFLAGFYQGYTQVAAGGSKKRVGGSTPEADGVRAGQAAALAAEA